MSDAELDREIQEALAIEPSPGFAARVRSRLAHESKPDSWHVGWMVAGALVAAVVLAFAIQRPPGRTAVRVGDVRLAPTPRLDGPAETPASPTRTEASAHGNAQLGAEPQVLVPPAELEGLRHAIMAVRDGRFQAVSAPTDSLDVDVQFVSVPEITIPPITIEPINE